jgi:hypothetical protein
MGQGRLNCTIKKEARCYLFIQDLSVFRKILAMALAFSAMAFSSSEELPSDGEEYLSNGSSPFNGVTGQNQKNKWRDLGPGRWRPEA